jgi:hypothetical protein
LVARRIKKYGLRGRGLAREYFNRPLNDVHLADDYHNPDDDDDDEMYERRTSSFCVILYKVQLKKSNMLDSNFMENMC